MRCFSGGGFVDNTLPDLGTLLAFHERLDFREGFCGENVLHAAGVLVGYFLGNPYAHQKAFQEDVAVQNLCGLGFAFIGELHAGIGLSSRSMCTISR